MATIIINDENVKWEDVTPTDAEKIVYTVGASSINGSTKKINQKLIVQPNDTDSERYLTLRCTYKGIPSGTIEYKQNPKPSEE